MIGSDARRRRLRRARLVRLRGARWAATSPSWRSWRTASGGGDRGAVGQPAYLQERVKQERYDFDARQVRPYFEYGRVKQGVLASPGGCSA